jgi:hypothetical protein
MKKALIILTTLLFALFLSTCTKKAVSPIPEIDPTVSKCDTITYTKAILPIMEQFCIRCHNESFGGSNFKLYAELKEKALNGKLKSYTVDGIPKIMPLGESKLAQDKLDLILCWISNGAKQ